jgi:poly(A) polymerase
LLEKIEEIKRENIKPEPLVKGRDLITMGYTPGPSFGLILEKVYDMQLEEKLTTRRQALEWIEDNFDPEKPV